MVILISPLLPQVLFNPVSVADNVGVHAGHTLPTAVLRPVRHQSDLCVAHTAGRGHHQGTAGVTPARVFANLPSEAQLFVQYPAPVGDVAGVDVHHRQVDFQQNVAGGAVLCATPACRHRYPPVQGASHVEIPLWQTHRLDPSASPESYGFCESDESDVVGDLATGVVVGVGHDLLIQEVFRWFRSAELESLVVNFTILNGSQVPVSQSDDLRLLGGDAVGGREDITLVDHRPTTLEHDVVAEGAPVAECCHPRVVTQGCPLTPVDLLALRE